jgi:hypothetical protein
MQMYIRNRRTTGLSLFVFGFVLVTSLPANAQFWDKLTKPQATLNLTHPPGLGLNIKRVAFGPSTGDCSAEIMDRLSRVLSSGGIEILDMQAGRAPGAAALVTANISRCDTERRRDSTEEKKKDGTKVTTFHAILSIHIRGSLRVVDPATGSLLSSSPLDIDTESANHSTEGKPEFPSADQARDDAMAKLTSGLSANFLPWNEQKKLTFFNDKECNLSSAWALLKGGDFEGTVRQSEENIAACPTWPKVKDNTMAHAYYDAGIAYLMVSDSEKALSYLNQSANLKGGDIVADAIAQVKNSVNLAVEMQQVAARTQDYEQAHGGVGEANQPARANAAEQGATKGSSASVEERLRKLNDLLRQGLITQQEFDAKKAEILKDI